MRHIFIFNPKWFKSAPHSLFKDKIQNLVTETKGQCATDAACSIVGTTAWPTFMHMQLRINASSSAELFRTMLVASYFQGCWTHACWSFCKFFSFQILVDSHKHTMFSDILASISAVRALPALLKAGFSCLFPSTIAEVVEVQERCQFHIPFENYFNTIKLICSHILYKRWVVFF